MARLRMRTLWWLVALAGLAPGMALGQASPSAYTSAMRYDALHRVTGTIAPDPDGSGPLHYAATRTTYDADGRVIRQEKGELASWQAETIAPSAWAGFTVASQVDTTYDAMDRKLVETSSAGGTAYTLTQYSYDSIGRLQCTAVRMNPAIFTSLPASACTLGTQGSQGPDRITKNVYDAAGQLIQVRRAAGTSLEQAYTSYSYTVDGKQEYVIDANGNRAKLTYDGFDRQIGWYFPSPTMPSAFNGATQATALSTAGAASTTDYEAYTYDADDNRLTLKKRDGQTIAYSYDALNRMTLKGVPGGTTADVYYGYDVEGRQLYARFGSAGGAGITSTYDGFGELISSSSNMDGTARTLNYQYDADGNRTRVTYPDGNYWSYVYDGLDRPVAINENGATQVASFAYDPMGRRSGDTRGAVTQAYGYDGISRLTSLSHDLAGTADNVNWTLGYNPASLIISAARSNDLYSYAYIATTKSYAVNGLNQYTTAGGATLAYDANGNITSDGTTTYGYDVENRMITASNGTTLDYDPTGRLWRVTSPTTLTTFLYDGDAQVEEHNSGGTLLRRYIHGNDEDDPLLWYEGSGLTDRRGITIDHQGSIAAIANSGGTLIQIDSYDEYGVPGTNNIGRFQYTGQAWIPELGIYYYKARMYSSRLGRFLQTDPIGYKDQINLYAYVANDPVNHADSSGLWTCGDKSAAQCGAVSEGLSALSKDMGHMSKSDAATAKGVLAAYGNEGVKNGVVVEAGKNMGDYPATTSTKNGITTVSINPGITSGKMLSAYSGGSEGAIVGHEGIHVMDERGVLGGRDPRTAQESYDTERRAYNFEGRIFRSEGVTQYGSGPLWNNDWRGNPNAGSLMNKAARYDAWEGSNHRLPGDIDAW